MIVSDVPKRSHTERTSARELLGELGVPLPHHGSQLDHAIVYDNSVEPGQTTNVDQHRRSREAHAEHRDEALTTRKDFGVLVLAENADHAIQRGGRDVPQRSGLHVPTLPSTSQPSQGTKWPNLAA